MVHKLIYEFSVWSYNKIVLGKRWKICPGVYACTMYLDETSFDTPAWEKTLV